MLNHPKVLTFDQFDRIVGKSRAFENESRAMAYARKTGGILYTQVDGDHGDRVYMLNPDKYYNRTGRWEVVTSFGNKTIRAAKGYHGVIRKPTKFVIGEGRYPERVNITPIRPGHRKQHSKLSIGHVDIGNIKIKKFI